VCDPGAEWFVAEVGRCLVPFRRKEVFLEERYVLP